MDDLAPMAKEDQRQRENESKHLLAQVKRLQEIDPEDWQVFRELMQPPALIAVMGMTGAGKSTLIGALGGRRVSLESGISEEPVVGHDGESGQYHILLFWCSG
jgi:putative ribosome biogenesis GTPase RsgA